MRVLCNWIRAAKEHKVSFERIVDAIEAGHTAAVRRQVSISSSNSLAATPFAFKVQGVDSGTSRSRAGGASSAQMTFALQTLVTSIVCRLV